MMHRWPFTIWIVPPPFKIKIESVLHSYIHNVLSFFFAELISCFHDDFFFFPSLLTCSLSQWSEIISFMEYFCNSVCTCIFTRHFSIALFISNKGDVYLPLVTYLSNYFVKKIRRNWIFTGIIFNLSIIPCSNKIKIIPEMKKNRFIQSYRNLHVHFG